MSDELKRLPMTDGDRGRLRGAADELTWAWARRLAGVTNDESPLTPYESDCGDERTLAVRLAHLRVLKNLAGHIDLMIEQDVLAVLDHGAEVDDVAAELGVSRQAVAKRWGKVRHGDRVAVVISRRNRVHSHQDDPRGQVGEVGGADQYDSDRGLWPAGQRVRAEARYAVIAVDGTVRRIYEIAPGSWEEADPGRWQFEAIEGRPLDQREIDAAHEAGDLPMRPGDDCPTRIGRAYRPHWF